jgi:MraZ protein
MLIGEYQHNIDEKGRVFIPARLRTDLGEEFIITEGLDNCLFAYSMKDWESLAEKLKALPMSKTRNLKRFLFSRAVNVEADKQGRVVIPATLRQYAALSKDVTIIGASTHAEIWDKLKWEEACASITSESVAEAMDELGF